MLQKPGEFLKLIFNVLGFFKNLYIVIIIAIKTSKS